jgi:beta-N-acetylhexosaminidase
MNVLVSVMCYILPSLTALLLMPTSGRTHSRTRTTRSKPSRELSSAAEAWVQSTRRKMSLQQKLSQLVTIPCFGRFLSSESAEFHELARQVEQHHIGGLIVHTRPSALGIERSQAYPAAALVNLLQSRARIPLLVASDFERGTAMRLEEGTSFPHAMAVAATGRTEDAYTVGRITALEARSVGVQWIFAPVADVNSDPANPVINMRSFGEDPRRVAAFVAAYVRGVEENGALATAKHFPGHGETNIDSHLALPTVKSDRAHIESVELVPFRSTISAGVSTIMTGHLAVPALEPAADLPTTFSKKITTGLLRRKMGFDGLIVTDDLHMGAVSARYPAAEVAVLSILAGSDMLLVFADIDAVLTGLWDAATSGRLPVSRIDDAVTRVLRAKARLSLHKHGSRVSLDALPKTFGRPEFHRAAMDIAGRGVTLLRDTHHLVPLDATQPRRALLVAISADPDRCPGLDLEQELLPRVDSLQVLRADTRFHTVDRITLPPSAEYDLIIVALLVRITNTKESMGLAHEQAAFIHHLLASDKPAIVVCCGNPYLIADFPEAKTWLAAFSNADVAQRAAARALFGQIPTTGRIPVSIPGVVSLGAGINVPENPMKLIPCGAATKTPVGVAHEDRKLAPVYALLDRAISRRAFPGAVVAIGHDGQLALHAAGKLSYDAKAPRATPDTIYDAASLTKPVVTATLAAMLEEAGKLQFDAPVARYVPGWTAGPQPDWRGKITLRHLLTHTSGLPAHKEYFKTRKNRSDILAAVLSEPLTYEPGAQSVYSDLGFILLGDILERLTGKSLDQLARELIFAPLAMHDTMFNPPKSLRSRIAPTENDREFRKRLIRGEVHDENAWVMGGVSGHAGMFSTAPDLAAFCQMLLNGGIYAHQRLLRRATIARITAPEAISGNIRTLGWMTLAAYLTSGRKFSPNSFGYLAFTGTSIWIDPEKQLFVILLTNRVHPTRKNEQIHEVRRAFHELVVEALGLVKG